MEEGDVLRRRRACVRRALWEWGQAIDLCRSKQAQIAALGRMADEARDTLGAQRITGMPRGGHRGDATQAAVQRICDSYRQAMDALALQVRDVMARKRALDVLIDDLPPEQRRLAYLRYYERKSWVMVGAGMCYDPDHAKKVERGMLDTLADMLAGGGIMPL
nr:hypothetical protein [Maliibacterium massiliense]